jgi:hypothetical protein
MYLGEIKCLSEKLNKVKYDINSFNLFFFNHRHAFHCCRNKDMLLCLDSPFFFIFSSGSLHFEYGFLTIFVFIYFLLLFLRHMCDRPERTDLVFHLSTPHGKSHPFPLSV